MSRKLDLKLNLSLPAASRKEEVDPPARSSTATAASPSSWLSEEEAATTSMVVTGCPRCLMYVMLAEDILKCPKCGSTVIIDFFQGGSGSAPSEKKNKSQNKKRTGV